MNDGLILKVEGFYSERFDCSTDHISAGNESAESRRKNKVKYLPPS